MQQFNKEWTLFLDRDGVINERTPNDYIKQWNDFVFIKGVPLAMETLTAIFGRIVVVTNQQGVGKGLMTDKDLRHIHRQMCKTFDLLGGKIDKVYSCTALTAENSPNRKPETGMATQAKTDFPEIDFQKSVMVGDSVSDMKFGQRLGMTLVFIEGKGEPLPPTIVPEFICESLPEWVKMISQ